jgi:signal transduction histidine kinase
MQLTGFGIGLYLVHEIVTRHGGQVMVDSVEGEGSTFTVRLPLLSPQSNNLPAPS